MSAGDEFREIANRGDAVSLLGVSKAREIRGLQAESEDAKASRTAYIMHSFKRKDEVRTFREIYGASFILISVFSPLSQRTKTLCERIATSRNSYSPDDFKPQSGKLILRDRKESEKLLGQDVEATFPEADFFLDGRDAAELGRQTSRVIQILFGRPYMTPTVDELGMFHARASSLRSSDLSRQVRAVITTSDGEILAAGCNEVPRAGGGINWEPVANTDKDYRDHKIGYDATAKMKHEILTEVFTKIKVWLQPSLASKKAEELVQLALYDGANPLLKGSRADSLLEFGRIVHAEMAAITEAARRGIAVAKSRLYSTTFPCHMCARHIMAAGISEVIYIEPYPKSLAKDLYEHMICVDDDDAADENAVKFRPFVGVAPRRFIDMFQAGVRKDNTGRVVRWEQEKANPRVGAISDYNAAELAIMTVLDAVKKKVDRTMLFDDSV